MINTFGQIDHLASAGRTAWHRASAVTKLALTLLVVASAVFTPSWGTLVALLAGALILCATARLPARLIAAAASTPLLFSALFVLAHWHGDWGESAVLLARPMVASLTAVWLVGTTPYPDLFAPISRVLPRHVGDGLFLTYRAVFALLARLDRLWKALVLRGGMGRPTRARVAMAGEAVGSVVLSSFDRSERLYRTMLLRGHSGRICGCRHWLELAGEDAWVALAALAALVANALLWGVRLPR